MKNALLLLSIWVGIIVAAYAMVYWDRGGEPPLPASVLEPADSAYVDPEGRFSLVVPAGWDLDEADAHVLLTDPSGEVEVTVLAVEEPIPEAALVRALGIVCSDEESGAIPVEEIPSAGASERAVRITGPASDGESSYGLAYLYGGETVVILVRGDPRALESRAEDLARIGAGISVPAGAETAPSGEVAPVVEL